MMQLEAIPVLIVGYRNVDDVVGCLMALGQTRAEPAFEIFICENGGPEAYEALVEAMAAEDGPCIDSEEIDTLDTPALVRRRLLTLKCADNCRPVHVGEARENLGYAGGVNAWLRPLLVITGWPAVWILNPDSEPTADALLELAAYAKRWGKGMVGSRLVPKAQPDRVHSRGLAWCRQYATTRSVDLRALGDFEPDPEEVDARLDSPSGASMYVTRPCIEQIGLMDEGYFLYFEDLEWGIRAKRDFGVGYAHRSVVVHAGGTTIGSSIRTANKSALSIYLEFRNTILFVRKYFPNWLIWTILLQVVRVLLKAHTYPPGNLCAALRGIAMGIAGNQGRPDDILQGQTAIKTQG
jgi:N-acetylglucosaminyl-diphospho-decaprenol L-rhamnosyltransferase